VSERPQLRLVGGADSGEQPRAEEAARPYPGELDPERYEPSVAVIVPCFNDGATLREAVDSARSQQRVGEVVVVDDGSTDPHTLEVIATLEREGTATVVRRQNGGLAAARMSGVQASSSDYVLPLDADDRLTPDVVARMARTLDRQPNTALVWGDYRLFGDRDHLQKTADDLDPWQIAYQNDLPSTALIRRSALLDAGGWEPSGGYEDWNLWMSLAERSHEGRRLHVAVYEYRQHGVRMLRDSATRHGHTYALLRERHPALFKNRKAAWWRSTAPLSLQLVLPIIFRLPIGANRRRLLGGAACHLANGRGVGVLWRRVRDR
jgi:glycosyltransferase involved in cell wall biosynthesis